MTRLKEQLKRLRTIQDRKDLNRTQLSTVISRRIEQIQRESKVKPREDRVGA